MTLKITQVIENGIIREAVYHHLPEGFRANS